MDQYETEAIKRWGERAESSIELWKSYTNDQRDLVLQAMDENYKVIAQLMHEGASMDSPEVQERVRIWHEQLYYFLLSPQSNGNNNRFFEQAYQSNIQGFQ